jgi:RimJ/RimL family protein N-acetyltransferase
MEPVEITEIGLLLRSWRPADAEAVYRACQDPLISRWTGLPSPYRRQDAEGFVGQLAPRWLAEDSAVHLGVFDDGTGELLGACGLINLDLDRGLGELGYWTAAAARGRGVAVRAGRVLARWAFDALGLQRLEWRARVGNHASRLVALRLGVRMEGILRAARIRDGGRPDSWIGSLLPGELVGPDREPARTGAMTGRTPAQPAGPGSPEARRATVFSGEQPELTARAGGVSIRLRPPTVADLDAVVAACRDDESVRWTTVPHPYERGDAEFFVGPQAQGRWLRGDGAVYAIVDSADRYAGSMALRIKPCDPAVGDVGFLVAPHARGRGYAPAALRVLCQWGVRALDLSRIEWRAHVGNDASRRVAEKAGFTLEGTVRAGLQHRGERRDAWLGALLAGDLNDDPPSDLGDDAAGDLSDDLREAS